MECFAFMRKGQRKEDKHDSGRIVLDDAFRGVVSVSGSQRGDHGEPDPVDKKHAPCEAGTSTERKQWKLKIRLLKHERREKSSAAGSTVGTADQNAATGTGK